MSAAAGGGGSGGVNMSSLRQAGFTPGGGGSGGGGEGGQDQEEKRAAMEDARNAMLKGILTPEAKERLNRVSIVKPENARAVEDHLIRLARGGKLTDRVEEGTVIRLLEDIGKQADQHAGTAKKVVIQRKKRLDDSDDDDDDF